MLLTDSAVEKLKPNAGIVRDTAPAGLGNIIYAKRNPSGTPPGVFWPEMPAKDTSGEWPCLRFPLLAGWRKIHWRNPGGLGPTPVGQTHPHPHRGSKSGSAAPFWGHRFGLRQRPRWVWQAPSALRVPIKSQGQNGSVIGCAPVWRM